MKKLHLLKKSAAFLCVWALTMMPVSANDIHVATNGNNSNEGTVDAPLLTIDKAMEIVQPGDRILVHEGTYMIIKRIKIPALNTNPDLRCVRQRLNSSSRAVSMSTTRPTTGPSTAWCCRMPRTMV